MLEEYNPCLELWVALHNLAFTKERASRTKNISWREFKMVLKTIQEAHGLTNQLMRKMK